MSRDEIFGAYKEDFEDIICLSEINLYPYSIAKFWGQCGITANYGASIISSQFLSNNVLYNSISTILNELLENSLKYSQKQEVGIFLKLVICGQKTIVLQIKNYLEKEQYAYFKQFAKELIECNNLSEKYINHLEAFMPNGSSSGIGLLSILNIYNIKIGFKFSITENENFMVSIQTMIDPGGLVK
jgi:hypothetical protein